MLTIASLTVAILLASGLVWIASALIWTLLPWHKQDFARLPDEDAALASLSPQDIQAGQYHFPYMTSPNDAKNPGMQQKLENGPAGFMTVLPRGIPNMGKAMLLSVVFYLFVNTSIAYIATRTLPAGEDYMSVFRLTGAVAWLAYGMAIIPDAIWFGRPWKTTIKVLGDALIYSLLTAGAFGWLWPAGA